jgi:Reeler domain
MKKNYFFAALLLGSVSFFAFQTSESAELTKATLNFHKFSSGSPGGKTGAPGDATCTQCHGAAVGASTDNSLTIASGVTPVTNYIPGQTYNVAVVLNNSTGGVGHGFECLPLTPSNALAGTVTASAAGGTENVTSGGKQRVTHTNAGQTSWGFTWTAPATNVGTVTFYLATIDGENGKIRLSQHTIGSTAGVEEQAKLSGTVAFNPYSNSVVMNLNSLFADDLTVNIVDMNGKSVQFEKVGKASEGENSFTLRLNDNIKAGTYVAHVAVGNNFMTKQIQVSK